MADERVQRRLAAILVADVVGYSRLIRADEDGTLAALKTLRKDLIDPKIAENHGRVVKLMGDGLLAEFPSVVDAVRTAVEFQRAVAERNAGQSEEQRIDFRVGINLGDVVIDGDDIQGDGVNVASRLEGLAEPGGMCISAAVYDQVRDRIKLPFEDLGEREVKNIDRPVRAWRWTKGTSVTAEGPATMGEPPPLPDKPSIAVLPFDNMSGDPEQEYFSDGITEDIITGLSHVRWLFVIARNSTFAYKGKSPDVRRAARELGVRYVLEGSVQKAGNRVRISAQLIDAATGNHLWAERYDRQLADIFDLQDEITETIVAAIEPELGNVEQERARHKPPKNLDVWDYVLRARWHLHRYTRDDNEEAQRLYRRAVEMDPGFAWGHAGLARACIVAVRFGYTGSPAKTLADGYLAARNALSLDDKDTSVHTVLGYIHNFRGEHDSAIAELQTAIELNPSNARAYSSLGLALVFAGKAEAAIPQLERALRLSPQDPVVWTFMGLRSLALVHLKRYEEAVEWARRAVRQPNVAYLPYSHLASALGQLGRAEDARAALDDAVRLKPDFSLALVERTTRYRHPADLEHYLEGLRKAGLSE